MATPDRKPADEWDARCEIDLAVIFRRYLAENPPPGRSRIADDLQEWAENLERDGTHRLEALNGRRLRATESTP